MRSLDMLRTFVCECPIGFTSKFHFRCNINSKDSNSYYSIFFKLFKTFIFEFLPYRGFNNYIFVLILFIGHYTLSANEKLPGHCNQQLNMCFNSPCFNNATCVPLENDYRCECPVDYTGKFRHFETIENNYCEISVISLRNEHLVRPSVRKGS